MEEQEEKKKRGRPKKKTEEAAVKTQKAGSAFYNSVLRKIFLAGAINRIALLDDTKSSQNMYYTLSKALENGHIEVREYKEKYGNRNRMHKYFIITAKGIEYLRQNDADTWCKYLPEMRDCSVSIFPNDRRQPAIAFNTRCGNTMLFASQLGASFTNFVFTGEPDESVITSKQVHPEKQVSDVAEKWWENIEDIDMEDFSDEEKGYILDIEESVRILGLCDEALPETTEFMDEYYEEDASDEASGARTRNAAMSLPDIKAETFLAMSQAGIAQWCDRDDVLFFFSKEIKKSLLGSEEVKYTDFAYGQYTGLLQTSSTSMILYHARHDGIGWSDRVEQKDIKTMRQFSVKCSPYDNISYGNIHGAILIYNEKNFADIVNNKWGKRKAGTTIGKSFDTMHLIPISLYGTSLMSWLLTNTPEDRLAYEDGRAEAVGLELNKGAYSKILRYKDGDVVVINGMEMDIKKLLGVRIAQKKLGDFEFEVFCFRWQEGYYKTLWPNANIIFAD